MKPKFKRGDIIQNEFGCVFIIALADDDMQWYFGFGYNTTYKAPYGQQNSFTKIGEFPMNTIEEAIDNAKNQFMDLQSQVNIAVELMDKFLDADGKDMLLVLRDMRVDKNANKVFVECSTGGGKPNRWVTVVDLCEEYGINKYGI